MRTNTLHIYTQGSDCSGFGHVVRSIALAKCAEEYGIQPFFITQHKPTQKILSTHNIKWHVSPTQSPNWIIRDLPDGSKVNSVCDEVIAGTCVLLMDEKGEARCEASIVVDAMMTKSRAKSYPESTKTRYVYGLQYTPLRSEIQAYCNKKNHEDEAFTCKDKKSSDALVIALGHGFTDHFIIDYLKALAAYRYTDPIHILLSSSFDENDELDLLKQKLNMEVHVNNTDVGPLISSAKLVVTKLGMTQLESFAMGVGCITVEPGAEHLRVQAALAREYQEWPLLGIGLVEKQSANDLAKKTVKLTKDNEKLSQYGKRGQQLIDGQGAERIIKLLIEQAS